ncbi:MAG: AAA family ATPase [Oscillospiraceae bacterium]|nr:AAA family ATPase [Oscillospiraceae bacterium]
MGQVIAVSSGKGGTGKTTLCAAVGVCLAAEGRQVLCIDVDLGLRNLDISLGMAEMAPISFADVLAGRYELQDATPHPEIPGLFLLTSPVLEQDDSIDFAGFGRLLQSVRERFDYCLIDSPAGIGTGFRLATRYADKVILVATPDPASLRDAARTADELLDMGADPVKLVVNRVTPSLFRRLRWTVDDIMDEVGLPLLGIVPSDENVVLAAAANQPLIRRTERGAALAFLHIARRLQGQKVPLLKL